MTSPEHVPVPGSSWAPGHRVQRWLATRGYYHFLLGLIFTLFLLQPLAERDVLGVASVGRLTIIAVVVGAVLAVSNRRWRMLVAGLLAVPLMYLNLLPGSTEATAQLASYVAGLLFFAFVVGCLLVDLFHQDEVDSGTVSSSLCIYLLVALAWGYIYTIIWLLDENSFRGLPGQAVVDGSNPLFYFSLVTVTTLGYGDIVPVSRTAQTYAAFEAIVGQLYLVVIVARLVGVQVGKSIGEQALEKRNGDA